MAAAGEAGRTTPSSSDAWHQAVLDSRASSPCGEVSAIAAPQHVLLLDDSDTRE
jgi:hypothetical protein